MAHMKRVLDSLALMPLAVVVVLTVAPAAKADPPATGTIVLTDKYSIRDTHAFPFVMLQAGVDQVLPSGSITITIMEATTDGIARVLPCGAVIDPWADAEFVFYAGEVMKRHVALGEGFCLRSTTAVHNIVIGIGNVVAPVAGGLQYHALPSSEVVFDGDVAIPAHPTPGWANAAIYSLTLPAGVPSEAATVVYRIDATSDGDRSGYITKCPPAQTWVPNPDFTLFGGDETSTVTYRNRAASLPACLLVNGGTEQQATSGHVTVTVLGWLEAGGPDPAAVPPELRFHAFPVAPPGLEPIAPTRVLDTRNGIGSIPEPLHDDEVLVLDLGPYITDWTTSVVMNVTVTAPVAAGFVAVFPCDVDEIPNASNLNFVVNQTVPNLVSVPVAYDGTVCMVTSATTDLIADLAGTYEFGGGSLGTAVAPERILDTRTGNGAAIGAVGAGQTVTLQVSGRGGLPTSGMTAVTMNVTVAGPEASGYVTVSPCDQPLPNASNLNFVAQRDVPNLVTVKVSPVGTVCLTTTAKTHLIADAAMWFGDGGTDGFYDLSPTRILDSRQPSPLGLANPRLPLVPGMPYAREVIDAAGVSLGDVHAVVMNVTVVQPFGLGYLTVHPCGDVPNASNLNFVGLQNVPNLVVVKTSAGNQVCFSTTVGTDVLADVAGYFSSAMVPLWDYVLVD